MCCYYHLRITTSHQMQSQFTVWVRNTHKTQLAYHLNGCLLGKKTSTHKNEFMYMFGKSLVAWGTHFLNLLSRLLFGTSVLYSIFFLVRAYLFEVEKLKNHFYGWVAHLEQKIIFSETGERYSRNNCTLLST